MEKRQELENFLAQFPIYQYAFLKPSDIPFTERVRWICRTQCPRYGKSWSCPPATGSVESCEERAHSYRMGLLFSTVEETDRPLDLSCSLQKNHFHEEITDCIEQKITELTGPVLTLSSESCAICGKCTYPSRRCVHPNRMHPCIEGQGILVAGMAENAGMDYYLDEHTLLWFSLILFRFVQPLPTP